MKIEREKRGRRGPCGLLGFSDPEVGDFGGLTFWSSHWLVETRAWLVETQVDVTSVNRRSDLAEIKSLQLESLILAQSERWRQA